MSAAEDIKAKLDIVDIIRDYVALKPAGRIFKGLCPFHNEKSPSFTVTPEKQIWHCFGCAKGGDVISFIMEREGLSFVEALRFLAPRAGVVLKMENPRAAGIKNRSLDSVEEAAAFYARALDRAPGSEAAREYLAKRGLTKEVIEDWQIGFSPNSWDDLLNYLKSRGYQERELDGAGLAIKSQRGTGFYNRFRGRIMFPIRDAASHTVGFTGRVLPGSPDAESTGKYVNSPQSVVFDKSKILFGLDKAKNHIREIGEAVVVEGQMDCITAHQFGFKNTVASSGTALTEEQLAQLARFTQTIVLALDADSAGQKAAERAGELAGSADLRFVEARDRWGNLRQFIDPAKSYKMNIKVAIVPAGKDPDEAIRQSPELWRRALSEAMSLAEFYFERAITGLDLDRPEAKTAAANRFLPFVAKLPSEVEKDHWVRRLAAALQVDEQAVYTELRKFAKVGPGIVKTAAVAQPRANNAPSRAELLSENLLALLLKFNAYFKYILDYILPEQISGELNRNLYKSLILYYNQEYHNQGGRLEIFALSYDKFKAWLLLANKKQDAAHLDRLMVLALRDYSNLDDKQGDIQLRSIASELKGLYLNNRRREIGRLIAHLDSNNKNGQHTGELTGLMRELAALNDELKRLSK